MADESRVKERVLNVTRPGIKPKEVIDFYKTWAKEYDQDHFGGANYTGPWKVAEAVAASLGNERNARVLDVAAGTGFLGVELSKLGFTNVDALDASQEMLDVAKTKNDVYKNFIKDFLGPNRLNIKDDTYDVVTGSGLFSNGHVKSDCLDELIRVVKPGGLVCLALREVLLRSSEDCKALEPRMAALQSDGCWEQIKRDVFSGYVIGFDGVVYLFKVL